MHGDYEEVQYGPEHGVPHFPPLGKLTFFPKTSRFLGMAFGTGRGVTKGEPASPMIFNIVVFAVAIDVLEVVFEPQEAQHRMGWEAGERDLVFYTYYGWIVGQDNI